MDVGRLLPEDIDAIAARVLAAVRHHTDSPWLTADEAANYLRAPLSRVRKLTMTGDLPHERDGRRVLYHRDRLDEFVQRGGATSP
jgi:excisionase family DNA binding protein